MTQTWMMPLERVKNGIDNGFSHAQCHQIHPLSCNQFCLNYCVTTWQASYKTYAAAYALQLAFKLKNISKHKHPAKQIVNFFIAYLKSTSLTAVQMMLMRRVLCLLARYHRNTSKNLLAANAISAIYLLVESPGRQAEIALYQLNNTSLVIYNMLRRRGHLGALPQGQALLFAVSVAIIAHFLFNFPAALRNNYIHTIFNKLIGQQS